MQKFEIWSPRWRDRKVLLKDSKIADLNKVVFTGKDGASMGTEPYGITKAQAKKYPTESMEARDGTLVKMRVIPIDELELIELDLRCEHEI